MNYKPSVVYPPHLVDILIVYNELVSAGDIGGVISIFKWVAFYELIQVLA